MLRSKTGAARRALAALMARVPAVRGEEGAAEVGPAAGD